jgi:hypothetical protein
MFFHAHSYLMSSLGLSFAETALSGAFRSISPFTKDKNVNNINWGDYNYPPCVHIVHYDPEDIHNEHIRSVVLKMNKIVVLTVWVCALNLVDTIVSASLYKDAKWDWVFYSILNVLLIPSISLYVFFQGYKGLALNDLSYLQKFSILGTMQSIFYFIFIIMPFGATNGLLSFAMYDVGIYWMIAIAVESTIWAVAFGLCIYTVIFVARGDYNMLPVVSRVK